MSKSEFNGTILDGHNALITNIAKMHITATKGSSIFQTISIYFRSIIFAGS